MMTGCAGGHRDHHVAPRTAGETQVDDRRHRAVLMDRVDRIVGSFGRHDLELMHLEELLERTPDALVVLEPPETNGGALVVIFGLIGINTPPLHAYFRRDIQACAAPPRDSGSPSHRFNVTDMPSPDGATIEVRTDGLV
jgi:hypothetical protein